ncbi:MAG: response regulator [Candidatus Cloacimonetes bacterium]|nr:response regulator [Candidatus Cloacimonadota bacterium]
MKIDFKLQEQNLKLSALQSRSLSTENNEKLSSLGQENLSRSINLVDFLLILLLINIFALLWVIKKSLNNPLNDLSTIASKIKSENYDLTHQEQEVLKKYSGEKGPLASAASSLYSLWLKTSKLRNDSGLALDAIAPLISSLSSHRLATFLLNSDGLIHFQNIQANTLLNQLGIELNSYKTHLFHFMSDASTILELIKDDSKMPFQMKVHIQEETIVVDAVAIYDSESRYIGPMITWELITKRIDQRNTLNRSARISHASPICTMAANLEGIIDFVNQASLDKFETLKDFLPIKVEEILGSSVDVFHSNPKHVDTIISDPENLPYESQILLGGETIQLNLSALFDDFNNYSGVLLHWSIITKELEAQNKQLQRLLSDAQQGSIAKSNFLSNMTHELRTPLNGVIGFTDLLLDGELNDDQRESLGIVKDCASGLLDLVNDLLDLNSISTQQMRLEYKPLYLEDIVFACNNLIRPKIGDKNIELLISMPEIQGQVVFDSFRLKQVLNNLLSNAVKFTQKGEVLTKVEVQSENETSIQLKFSVSDSGVGIAKENYSKILERFEQGDGSVTRKYNGVGLGLPLCKRILEIMGSELNFQSELGQGSTFSFVLNLQKNISLELTKERAKINKEFLGVNVLVVEANSVSLSICSELCRSMGCEVFNASNVEEASELIQTKAIEVVLVNIDLKDSKDKDLNLFVDGVNQDIKKIALTTELKPEVIDAIQSKSFDSFLVKPIKRSVLFKSLIKVLKQGKDSKGFGPLLELGRASTLDILVAEDNLINQKMIEKILVQMGHSVTISVDGRQAINKASQRRYDIILMDIDMPNTDGIEATKEILQSGGDTPVIALIENGDANDKRVCFTTGMVDYITKPFVRKNVYDVLQKYSNEQKHVSLSDVPKILVAEDDDGMLFTINNILREHFPSAIVKTARDGIEASAILASFAPNILIVDLMMPNMNGQDLMRYMNGQEKYKDIKVIVISALLESDQTVLDVKNMRELEFIPKPFKLDVLVLALNKYLAG